MAAGVGYQVPRRVDARLFITVERVLRGGAAGADVINLCLGCSSSRGAARGTVRFCVLWDRRRGGVSLGGMGTTFGREESPEALETPRTAKVAKIAKNDSY